MDQLIHISRTYLSYFTREDINVERAYNFIEWVILVANGSIIPIDRDIQDKFLIARIWGYDQSLIEINDQLNVILKSSIDDSDSDDNCNDAYVTHIIQSSLVIGSICPSATLAQQDNPVPEGDLINLNDELRILQIQLWQGTDGVMVFTADGRQNYLGRLSGDCREILLSPTDDIPSSRDISIMRTNCMTAYTNSLKSNNVSEHYRLVNIVRRHVNNPCRFPIPARSAVIE